MRNILSSVLSVLMSAAMVCALAPPWAFAEGEDALPGEYYLLNLGYVTPAKLQSPWGTCWAFAVASAVESSILKASAELAMAEAAAAEAGAAARAEAIQGAQESGPGGDDGEGATDAQPGAVLDESHPMAAIRKGAVSALDEGATAPAPFADEAEATDAGTAESAVVAPAVSMDEPDFSKLDGSVDISERAIGWYVHEPQTEVTGGSQAGEGYGRTDVAPLTQFEGGNFSIATAMLVARQALLLEEDAPYRYNGYDGSGVPWFRNASSGADARARDWSLDSKLRTSQDVGWYVSDVLELPSPAVLETDINTGLSTYQGYDEAATRLMKRTIMDVGALAVCLNSELSLPSELTTGAITESTLGDAINYSTWSQYSAAESFALNHAVAIVGWDDSYPADAFRNASGALPPAPGAWLCKNNWGSAEITAANGGADGLVNWGIRGGGDTGTDATGFFWLSFYDHTINTPVAFEVSPEVDTTLYQYDYLGTSEFFHPTTYTSDVLVANVFTARSTELIDSVAGWTFDENETIHTFIYALPPDDDAAGASGSADAPMIETGEEFKAALATAPLLAEDESPFEFAGFHTIDLADPVLVYEGERFAVIQQVDGIITTFGGEEAAGSYLNLEVAFADTLDYENVASKPNVVSNPGESFVSIYGPEDWRSVSEYNDWYADLNAQGNQSVDMIFGNALVKAITKATSMTSDDRIYEHVRLEPVAHDEAS